MHGVDVFAEEPRAHHAAGVEGRVFEGAGHGGPRAAVGAGLALDAPARVGEREAPREGDLFDAPAGVDDPRGVGAAWALPVSVGVGVCPRFGARVVTYVCATLAAGVVVSVGDRVEMT